MKLIGTIMAMLITLSATCVLAQDDPPPTPPDAGKRPVPPLMKALDANKDGQIDAQEIAGASAALATLDKNNDGILTADEIRPPRPPKPDDANATGNRGGDGMGQRNGQGKGRQGPPPAED